MVQVDDASRERRAQTAENERQAELLRELARMTEGLSACQFRRLVLRSLVSGLLVLALAGCGSEGGRGEDGPVECTEQEGLAPCCDATPLTAADCPQGTTFQLFDDPEHDVAGEACVTETGSGAGRQRVTNQAGAVTQVYDRDGGHYNIICSPTTGRVLARLDTAAECLAACYDEAGALLTRAECPHMTAADACQE